MRERLLLVLLLAGELGPQAAALQLSLVRRRLWPTLSRVCAAGCQAFWPEYLWPADDLQYDAWAAVPLELAGQFAQQNVQALAAQAVRHIKPAGPLDLAEVRLRTGGCEAAATCLVSTEPPDVHSCVLQDAAEEMQEEVLLTAQQYQHMRQLLESTSPNDRNQGAMPATGAAGQAECRQALTLRAWRSAEASRGQPGRT